MSALLWPVRERSERIAARAAVGAVAGAPVWYGAVGRPTLIGDAVVVPPPPGMCDDCSAEELRSAAAAADALAAAREGEAQELRSRAGRLRYYASARP